MIFFTQILLILKKEHCLIAPYLKSKYKTARKYKFIRYFTFYFINYQLYYKNKEKIYKNVHFIWIGWRSH